MEKEMTGDRASRKEGSKVGAIRATNTPCAQNYAHIFVHYRTDLKFPKFSDTTVKVIRKLRRRKRQ